MAAVPSTSMNHYAPPLNAGSRASLLSSALQRPIALECSLCGVNLPLRSGLCGGQSMCENDVSVPEPQFESMNPGIVILEYAHAIREEKYQ